MEKAELTQCVLRCQRGDEEAKEMLVLESQKSVYYQCYKMLKNPEDALDATQDVLMTMLLKLEGLKEPAAFWGWLNIMTMNHCRNLLKRRPQEVSFLEDEEGNSRMDDVETEDRQMIPDAALDTDETRRMVAALVDELPAAQRMTVLMYYYDEMSVGQIAVAMETSEGTVKSRLNYARKSIKRGVEQYAREGVKLYGALGILPFLGFFLGEEAQAVGLTAAQSAALTAQVTAGGATAVAASTTAASTTAASAAATSTAAAGSAAVTGAVATSAAVAAKAGIGLGAKIAAGVLAGALALGGGGAVVYHRMAPSSPASTPVVEESARQTSLPTAETTPSVPPALETRESISNQEVHKILEEHFLSTVDSTQYVGYFVDLRGDGTDELIVYTYEWDMGFCYIFEVDENGQATSLFDTPQDGSGGFVALRPNADKSTSLIYYYGKNTEEVDSEGNLIRKGELIEERRYKPDGDGEWEELWDGDTAAYRQFLEGVYYPRCAWDVAGERWFQKFGCQPWPNEPDLQNGVETGADWTGDVMEDETYTIAGEVSFTIPAEIRDEVIVKVGETGARVYHKDTVEVIDWMGYMDYIVLSTDQSELEMEAEGYDVLGCWSGGMVYCMHPTDFPALVAADMESSEANPEAVERFLKKYNNDFQAYQTAYSNVKKQVEEALMNAEVKREMTTFVLANGEVEVTLPSDILRDVESVVSEDGMSVEFYYDPKGTMGKSLSRCGSVVLGTEEQRAQFSSSTYLEYIGEWSGGGVYFGNAGYIGDYLEDAPLFYAMQDLLKKYCVKWQEAG